jgi:hypothetical protein
MGILMPFLTISHLYRHVLLLRLQEKTIKLSESLTNFFSHKVVLIRLYHWAGIKFITLMVMGTDYICMIMGKTTPSTCQYSLTHNTYNLNLNLMISSVGYHQYDLTHIHSILPYDNFSVI